MKTLNTEMFNTVKSYSGEVVNLDTTTKAVELGLGDLLRILPGLSYSQLREMRRDRTIEVWVDILKEAFQASSMSSNAAETLLDGYKVVISEAGLTDCDHPLPLSFIECEMFSRREAERRVARAEWRARQKARREWAELM